ncbi:unnamed protein product [Somion occarium]|uniref:Uncharacterized protein n=1 Tax=Somion occarium TaxID=3059160 RepID=A0ABP1DD32_9APHY
MHSIKREVDESKAQWVLMDRPTTPLSEEKDEFDPISMPRRLLFRINTWCDASDTPGVPIASSSLVEDALLCPNDSIVIPYPSIVVYLMWRPYGPMLFPVEIQTGSPNKRITRYKMMKHLFVAIQRWHEHLVECDYRTVTAHHFKFSYDITGVQVDELKLDRLVHYRGRRYVAQLHCEKMKSMSSSKPTPRHSITTLEDSC